VAERTQINSGFIQKTGITPGGRKYQIKKAITTGRSRTVVWEHPKNKAPRNIFVKDRNGVKTKQNVDGHASKAVKKGPMKPVGKKKK
jgi:hypothetical protein